MRSSPLRRRPNRRRVDAAERERRREFKRAVCRTGCVMCLATPPSAELKKTRALDLLILQAHHVIPQRVLRKLGLEEHLWDPRNGVPLCRYHHMQHEAWAERLPRALVPAAAYEFAADHQLDGLIEQGYPA